MPSNPAPDLWLERDAALRLLHGKTCGLFLDIDGTLSPIQPNHDAVTITERMRSAIHRLSQRVHVVLLSGRGVRDAHRIVGLDGVTYAGNHGVEWRVDGETSLLPDVAPYVEVIRSIAAAASAHFASWPGVFVEDKGPSLSIHYRGAGDPDAAAAAIDEFIEARPESQGFRRGAGKMVKELRPPVPADKGTAVRRVVAERLLTTAIMFGDDVTDVDAFRVVHALSDAGEIEGAAVGVQSAETPQLVLDNVDYVLESPDAVEDLLDWLAGQQ